MADDVVKTITIKGVPEGIDDTTDAVNKLGDAMASVSTVSDTTTKSTTSVQSALDRQQRSLDSTYRSQIQFGNSYVTLNKAVDQGLISQDRANQLIGLASQRLDGATSSAKPFGAAVNGIQTQLVALSAGAGPVGVFLASFGPWGLAAAAGIGAAVNGFEALTNAADQLAQKAQGLQTFSQITGLTTDQIQQLEEEGSKFGIQTDTIGKFLDQFSVKLATARDATGSYFDMVRQINPVLAQQVLTTQGEAAQLVILAAAYQQAGEKGNALLQAAGGRGAVQVAPLLGKLNSSGSIGALPASPQISSTEIDGLTTSLNANAVAADHVKTNIGAIAFNAGFLDNQTKARQEMEQFTALVRDFSPSAAWESFITGFSRLLLHTGETATPLAPRAAPVIPVEQGGNLPAATGTGAGDPVQIANQYKTYVAALGSAATAQEQFSVKVGEANIQLDKGVLSGTAYNRVIASAGLDRDIQLEGQRIGLLGELSTVSEVVKQKEDSIAQARAHGVIITTQEEAAITALSAAQKQYSDLQARANLGVGNFDVMAKAQAATAVDIQAYNVPLEQQGAVLTANIKKFHDLHDAAEVAGSNLPQLTQLSLDAGNVNKQLDTFATTSLNAVSPALQDMFNGTTTLSAGFQNLGLVVVKALENMIIQMTIIQPIALLLKNTLGSVGGGFNFGSFFGGSSNSSFGSSAANFADTTAAYGKVFDRSGLVPFASGGIVTGPTIFPFANGVGLMGEAGPEAIMPLKRGSDGRLGVAGGSGGNNGGNVTVHYSPQIDARGADAGGADAGALARMAAAQAQDRKDFGKNVLTIVTKAKQNLLIA